MLRFIDDVIIRWVTSEVPELPVFATPIMSPPLPVVITNEPPSFPCVEIVGAPTNDFLGAGP